MLPGGKAGSNAMLCERARRGRRQSRLVKERKSPGKSAPSSWTGPDGTNKEEEAEGERGRCTRAQSPKEEELKGGTGAQLCGSPSRGTLTMGVWREKTVHAREGKHRALLARLTPKMSDSIASRAKDTLGQRGGVRSVEGEFRGTPTMRTIMTTRTLFPKDYCLKENPGTPRKGSEETRYEASICTPHKRRLE